MVKKKGKSGWTSLEKKYKINKGENDASDIFG